MNVRSRRALVPLAVTAIAAASLSAMFGLASPTAVPSVSQQSAEPGSADKRDPDLVSMQIGTYNFRAARPLGKFRAAVDELKTRVSVAGLQEIADRSKNDHLLADESWGYYRPPELRQNPVIWDTDVFELAETPGGYTIAAGRWIENKTDGSREYKDDSYATVVRLRHLVSGRTITIVNVHLLSGASRVGLPYPGRPERFAYLVDQVRGTIRLLRRERELDTEVFLLGDFNVGFQPDERERHKKLPYRRYKRQGFASMWAGGDLERKGTFDNAYLDQIWARSAPDRRAVAHDIKGSDHRPALATYLLEPDLPVRDQGR